MIYKNLSISIKAYKATLQNFFNFLVVFSCFTITLPTAWSSIFLGLILITWMIYGNPIKKIQLAFLNPALKGTLLLIFLYILATFYSSADFSSSIHFLLKYSKLLLIPLILVSIDSEKIRNYGINAFLIGMLLTLFISYSKWLSFVPMHLGLNDNGEGFHAFKNRIAHNYLMSFAVYLMLCKSYFSSSYSKWIWLILSLLGFCDVFYLVDGRTGQVTLFFLILFFIFHVLLFSGVFPSKSLNDPTLHEPWILPPNDLLCPSSPFLEIVTFLFDWPDKRCYTFRIRYKCMHPSSFSKSNLARLSPQNRQEVHIHPAAAPPGPSSTLPPWSHNPNSQIHPMRLLA